MEPLPLSCDPATQTGGPRRRRRLGATTRIASYNLWNSTTNWEPRLIAIVDELRALAADVVVMQEAPTEASPGRSLASYLEAEAGYPHVLHLAYDVEPDEGDRPEGLALMSRLPWRDVWTNWGHGATTDNNWAMKVVIETAGRRLGITNVHLDWEHPDARLRGIAGILAGVVARHPADVEVLCGDFNDYEDGPVADFLEGRAGFEAAETAPWLDAVVGLVGRDAAPVTLDFAKNPRWKDAPVTERPGRFDRIYVRSASRDGMPRMIASGLFARQPANRFHIVPSDHYGIFVDLELG